MPDYPAFVGDPSVSVISTADPRFSPVADYLIGSSRFAVNANAAYPAASDAYSVPIHLSTPFLATKMAVINGATVSGNLSLGIYDVNNTLLAEAHTAQAGVSVAQILDITDVQLMPGDYFFAHVMDNTTGTNQRNSNVAVSIARPLRLTKMSTAYPLPNPWVPAVTSISYMPLIAVLGYGTVI